MPGSAAETTGRIRDAAARRFAAVGFERTAVRAVAADAGIDPALVIRYFGSKEALFAAVADVRLDLPDPSELSTRELADALAARFLALWDDDDTFRLLLRTAASSEVAARRLRGLFAEQAAPVLTRAALDEPVMRAAMVGAQVVGFAYTRYVIALEPLASMDAAEVRRWLGAAILAHLTYPTSDLPGPVGAGRRSRRSARTVAGRQQPAPAQCRPEPPST